MELTADTFVGLNQHIDFQQQTAIQAALGNTLIGLMPDAEFNNDGTFVRNTFEMEHFKCRALLPSGRIIDADERAVVNIPMLYGSRYYLTVSISDELTEFEKEGVPYVRPKYTYSINTLEDIDGKDMLPLARFKVQDGVFSLEPEYIPPTLQPICDNRFKEYIQKFISHLEEIATHKNMVDEFGKRAMLHYLFVLKSYNLKNRTSHFIQFLQEIAQAIAYYIIAPHTQSAQLSEIPDASLYDVEAWMKWLDADMVGAVSVLDRVVIEDTSIDFDELKAQIKAELYEQMTPELHDKLYTDLKDELLGELRDQLSAILKDYMENTLKPALMTELSEELSRDLYQRLYDALYRALYDALFVPTEEEDEFTPLI